MEIQMETFCRGCDINLLDNVALLQLQSVLSLFDINLPTIYNLTKLELEIVSTVKWLSYP